MEEVIHSKNKLNPQNEERNLLAEIQKRKSKIGHCFKSAQKLQTITNKQIVETQQKKVINLNQQSSDQELQHIPDQQKQKYIDQIKYIMPQEQLDMIKGVQEGQQKNDQSSKQNKSQYYKLRDNNYQNYKHQQINKKQGKPEKTWIVNKPYDKLENCIYNILKLNHKQELLETGNTGQDIQEYSDSNKLDTVKSSQRDLNKNSIESNSRYKTLNKFKTTQQFRQSKQMKTYGHVQVDHEQIERFTRERTLKKVRKEQKIMLNCAIENNNFRHISKPSWNSPYQNYVQQSKPQKILNQNFQNQSQIKNDDQYSFPIIIDNSLYNQINNQNTFVVPKEIRQSNKNSKLLSILQNQYFQKKDKYIIRVLKQYEYLNLLSINYGKSIHISSKSGPSLLQYAFSKFNQEEEEYMQQMQQDQQQQQQQEQEYEDQDQEQEEKDSKEYKFNQKQQQDDEYEQEQQEEEEEYFQEETKNDNQENTNNQFNVTQIEKNDQGILLIILKRNFNVLKNNPKELVDRILKALEIDPENDLGLVDFNQFLLFQRLFIINNATLEQKILFIVQFFQYGNQEIDIEFEECQEIIRLITQKIDKRNFKKVKQSYLEYIFNQFVQLMIVKNNEVMNIKLFKKHLRNKVININDFIDLMKYDT